MMPRHLFPHPWLSLGLGVVWLVLVQRLTPNALLMAGLLGTLIPLIALPPRTGARRAGARPLTLLRYAGLVLCDIVTANVAVARVVLFMRPADIRAAWIRVPIDLHTDAAVTILAFTITLTPGTVTADIAPDRRSLLIHALHAPDPDAVRDEIKARYEARLKAIFA